MALWMVKANGNVVPRRTLIALRVDEIHNPTEQKRRDTFEALIDRR